MSENHLNRNELGINENGDNHNINEFMLPPSNWVYLTPPMQKIKKPKLKGSSIQTAIMYRKNLADQEMYELKPNIMVDVAKFTNLGEIPFDPRYMRKIMFDQNTETLQEYEAILEPSRQTKFVSRFKMGVVTQESSKKLKRNLFDFETK